MVNKCKRFKEGNGNPNICLQSADRKRSHVTSTYHVTRHLTSEVFFTIVAMILNDILANYLGRQKLIPKFFVM